MLGAAGMLRYRRYIQPAENVSQRLAPAGVARMMAAALTVAAFAATAFVATATAATATVAMGTVAAVARAPAAVFLHMRRCEADREG
jgi:hypothetical protein